MSTKNKEKMRKMTNAKEETKTVVKSLTKECDGAKYTYTLYAAEGKRVACFGLTLYSVKIEMTGKDGESTVSELNDVFVDSKRAFRFYEKLVKNLATPIDLPYVFEDEMR